MSTSQSFLSYVLDQLSGLDGVSYRSMMGEYLIYVQGRLIGGIYDDRLLVKPTKAAKAFLPDAPLELPYEGAKPMLLVDRVDERAFLQSLLLATAVELPTKKST